MLPTYNGLRTYEKGPDVISVDAPTPPVTLVSTPAMDTPQSRMNSPAAAIGIPTAKLNGVGRAKISMTRTSGTGV